VILCLMEVGRLGAAVFGADRRVLWAAGALPCFAAEEAIGKSCTEVFAGCDQPCEPCLLERSAQEGPLRRILRPVRDHETRPRIYEVIVAPLQLPGQAEPHWLELVREIR